MEIAVKVEKVWPRKAYLVYFFATIALLGATAAYGVAFPLYILGRFLKPLRNGAEYILQNGIHLLMTIQPWYEADIQMDLPPGPYPNGLMIVANHRSHLDTFIVLSQIRRVRLMANRSLFFSPFIGLMLWAMGHIPAERNLASFWRAMDSVRAKLKKGEIVFVFPEFTRCSPGFRGLQDFASAPFHVAAQVGAPVLPMVIQGTDLAWPKGELAIYPHQKITVRTLPIITLSEKDSALDSKNRVSQLMSEHFKI